jgi:chemotaxis signal transduction protein
MNVSNSLPESDLQSDLPFDLHSDPQFDPQFDPQLSLSSTLSLGAQSYLLTEVDTQMLAFPASWIAEILVVERTQILKVPFYTPAVIGLFHHQSKVVPLISAHQVLAFKFPQEQAHSPSYGSAYGSLAVVCLNSKVASLAGISIAVDRVLHSCSPQALAEIAEQNPEASPVQVFEADFIPEAVWQMHSH